MIRNVEDVISSLTNPVTIPGEIPQLSSNLGSNVGQSATLAPLLKDEDNEQQPQPKSGINFVSYNNNFDIVEENTGVMLVEDRINQIQTLASDKIIMQEAGFIEIFVNNEAQTPVYYDNMTVVVRGGNAMEVNAYYPYGMIISGLSTEAPPSERNLYKYNAKELQKAVGKNTAAIMFEPVVAEGGILMPSKKFIETINQLKRQSDCLIIADEIQIGFGRCGAISCSELFGINADIATWAKSLGGGLPLGMVLMGAKISECLKPGDHGTTFGGNPVACAAGLAVLEIISKPKILANVKERSLQLKTGLEVLAKKYPCLGKIHGCGLLLGIECEKPVANVIAACREQGLLILRAGTNVLRFLPPLIVTKTQIKEALKKVDNAFTIL
jgi:hypothetical protein